ALDKLIAVVVALLILSLIVQSIQAAIKKFFHLKSRQLEQSLIHLFYYLLDKDAIKAMQTVSDRAPLLRAFFSSVSRFIPGHSKPLQARDPQVGALYQAVIEEFVRAGRVSPRGKMLIESVSKDDLIRFIRRVRVSELIEHVPLPERENMSEMKGEIAGARKAVKELFIKHRELIEQTPLAEIREPLLELLSDANQFLDLKNSDLTLGDLNDSALGAARKTLDALPDSLEETLIQLKDEASAEAAQALSRLKEKLAPFSDELKAVIALPQKSSQILGKVEIWYDTIMRSFDERYTRSMKSISLAISFAVVALLNANLFDIYREISANESKRNLIVQSGEQIASRLREQPAADSRQINQTLEDWSKKSYEEIDQNVSLYTALGFSGPRWIADAWKNPQWPTAQKTVETVAGWLIMTMLLSVGAPFWEDTLESLFGLKNFLRKKDPAAT
ncbi:MAG TPA: hypothetical protein VE715_18265, partial [Blastocatellia bacterium]|nr:hypothetical protein [Blastocatellia bacterium]